MQHTLFTYTDRNKGIFYGCLYVSAPSSPPLNIQAERVSATSFLVTWQPPADEDKNGIIRQYSTAISAKPSWLHSTRQVLFSNDTELTVTSLAPYVTYEIHIRAHTISPGPFSTGYLVTTSEAGKTSNSHTPQFNSYNN